MEFEDEEWKTDIANCYRICRNFQDYGAKTVMKKLREVFVHRTAEELMALIVEVEKITSQSSKPATVSIAGGHTRWAHEINRGYVRSN